ncbi:hypothetical protein TSMEX_002659 [Taenia solium]|eukprot:TsM_000618700 transcript=TsM_000618700 gene=TsM_000618700
MILAPVFTRIFTWLESGKDLEGTWARHVAACSRELIAGAKIIRARMKLGCDLSGASQLTNGSTVAVGSKISLEGCGPHRATTYDVRTRSLELTASCGTAQPHVKFRRDVSYIISYGRDSLPMTQA